VCEKLNAYANINCEMKNKYRQGRPLKALLRKVFLVHKKESGPSLPTEPISPAFARAVRHESL